MLGRLATYFVPASSVVVTALVLLGPGSPKQAPFARVRAVAQAGGKRLALRVEGGKRLFGVDDVLALDGVVVEAFDHKKPLHAWSGSFGADGVCEATLEATEPLVGPLDVVVRAGQTELVSGQIPLGFPQGPVVATEAIRGVTSGSLLLRVSPRRGVIAAPFEEDLDIEVGFAPHVSPYQEGFSGIRIKASAPGANITNDVVTTNEHGVATLRLAPLSHVVELTLEAEASYGPKGRWEGLLPVHAGAIWLDPVRTNGEILLLGPAPRDRAYVSVLGDFGRMFGAVVSLERDKNGFYAGRVTLPPLENNKTAALVVSGDPSERGSGTVVFPMVPDHGSMAAPRLELVLDGASVSEARERGRASKARKAAIMLVVAAAMAEVLLILVRSGRSQRSLDKNLAEAASAGTSEESGVAMTPADQASILATAHEKNPTLRLALAAALVLLGFAMIAALSTFSW